VIFVIDRAWQAGVISGNGLLIPFLSDARATRRIQLHAPLACQGQNIRIFLGSQSTWKKKEQAAKSKDHEA
jgi:hypothetical protein